MNEFCKKKNANECERHNVFQEHQAKFRVGQGFWVFGIQGRFKSGIRYIAA